MKLNDLYPAEASVQTKFRKGRGIGSGNGKTSGRGHKGQWARSGGGVRRGFEGGQMPLARRIPKRGFKNHFKIEYAIINMNVLNQFDNDAVVGISELFANGVIKNAKCGLKVLGNGELTKKLTVKAAAFSESAKQKIEAAGGKAEEV